MALKDIVIIAIIGIAISTITYTACVAPQTQGDLSGVKVAASMPVAVEVSGAKGNCAGNNVEIGTVGALALSYVLHGKSWLHRRKIAKKLG